MGAFGQDRTPVFRGPKSGVEWTADTRRGTELRTLSPALWSPESCKPVDGLFASSATGFSPQSTPGRSGPETGPSWPQLRSPYPVPGDV